MTKKQLDTIWLVLQNVNGIPNKPSGNMNLDCLRAFVADNNINIMALMELNMAWDCLHYNKQLQAKTKGWW